MKRTKFAVLVLACVMLALCLASAGSSLLRPDHDCQGERCESCAMALSVKSVLDRLAAEFCAAPGFVLPACFLLAPVRADGALAEGSCTPVELKVKLSD